MQWVCSHMFRFWRFSGWPADRLPGDGGIYDPGFPDPRWGSLEIRTVRLSLRLLFGRLNLMPGGERLFQYLLF